MSAPPCLRELFESVFMDNTEQEALALWEHLCRLGGEFPERALGCVDAAVADPPDDLIDVMQECGWIVLVHVGADGTVTPYTHDEHVQWLREMAQRLRERSQAVQAEVGADSESPRSDGSGATAPG